MNELPEDGQKSLPETLHFTENKWIIWKNQNKLYFLHLIKLETFFWYITVRKYHTCKSFP